MVNKNPDTTGIERAAKVKTETKYAAVEKAIRTLNKSKNPITVTAVAQEAGVSPPFIYNHPELIDKVKRLRETKRGIHAVPDKPGSDTVVSALRLKIRNMEEQHKNEVKALRQELVEANKRIERLTAELIQKN